MNDESKENKFITLEIGLEIGLFHNISAALS